MWFYSDFRLFLLNESMNLIQQLQYLNKRYQFTPCVDKMLFLKNASTVKSQFKNNLNLQIHLGT